jgi:hypothetical protein
MSQTPIGGLVLDLLWTAWTELGVPGVQRKHRRVAVDPDPLIVFTPALARDDPRLLEQAAAWCGRHGDRVSKTRLDGLRRKVHPDVASAFTTFVDRLGGAAAHWRQTKRPGGQLPGAPAVPPPLERPALARLRMRALAGTGARADVLCELLGSPTTWISPTDLERLGYTRRSIARVLADLAAARLASEKPGRGAASFRLREPGALGTLVAAEDLAWPDWAAVLALAWHLIQLERSTQPSAALAAVKARDAWSELQRLSLSTALREPPPLSGDSSDWPDLLRWGAAVLRLWPSGAAATT